MPLTALPIVQYGFRPATGFGAPHAYSTPKVEPICTEPDTLKTTKNIIYTALSRQTNRQTRIGGRTEIPTLRL